VAHLDFQGLFDQPANLSYDEFFRYLAYAIALRARIKTADLDAIWQTPFGARFRLTQVIDELLLSRAEDRILLVIDEADVLLHTAFYTDFFGLLRAWHNRRAFEPRWTKLDIVLVISTHPSLLIDDPRQSPFNVGLEIKLEDFDESQLRELNEKHGRPLQTSEIQSVTSLLGGHPYLIRQALYTLRCEGMTWAELAAGADKPNGPFGAHLRYYWEQLDKDPECVQAVKDLLRRDICPPGPILMRLESAGVVAVSNDGQCVFRYGLYRRFFRNQLL
jgi:hypothetical protein